jgi:hypothetical protein
MMGTAKQMMPAPYLECFADSMDNNPPAGHWALGCTLNPKS